MRRLSLLALLFGLVTAAACAGTLAPRARAATPVVSLRHHCSSSGDVCYGVERRGGFIYLHLTAVAHSFPEYHLCVTPPRGMTICRAFPLVKSGKKESVSLVRLDRNFPAAAHGHYKASWRSGWAASTTLGPALSFTG